MKTEHLENYFSYALFPVKRRLCITSELNITKVIAEPIKRHEKT